MLVISTSHGELQLPALLSDAFNPAPQEQEALPKLVALDLSEAN